MSGLAELAALHPTDKLWGHSYPPIYERLLGPYRQRKGSMLEIGVWTGGSLAMWRDWSTSLEIHGCDTEARPPYLEERDTITTHQLDAYTSDAIEHFKAFGKFQFIIDDGPHTLESQSFFCQHYPELLVEDGLAVVEDVQDVLHAYQMAKLVPYRFTTAVVDLRHLALRYDDVLLLIWKP